MAPIGCGGCTARPRQQAQDCNDGSIPWSTLFRASWLPCILVVIVSNPLAGPRHPSSSPSRLIQSLYRPAAVIGHSPPKRHGAGRMWVNHVNVCHKLNPLSSAAAAVLKLSSPPRLRKWPCDRTVLHPVRRNLGRGRIASVVVVGSFCRPPSPASLLATTSPAACPRPASLCADNAARSHAVLTLSPPLEV